MLTTLTDVNANLLSVVDVKTTIFTIIYWLVLLPWWLMLLPLSCRLCYYNGNWCFCSMFVVWLAGVIAMVADVIATYTYSVLADVIAMVVDVITIQGVYIVWQMLKPYMWLMELRSAFILSSVLRCWTEPYPICWQMVLANVPIRDGLFALMYRASFMVLKRFWSSLSSTVKLSMVTSWPEMLRWSYMGMGPWDVPCTSLQNFLLTLQYTHHL